MDSFVARLKDLVKEERRLTSEIISLLEKVQSARIFASMGYSSLFEFCVGELGYSESAAQRRIEAMRLTRDVPEVRLALETGTLSLSSVAKIQTFTRQQQIRDVEVKRNLLSAVQGKSARETDRYLASIAPQPIPQESQRVLTHDMTELKFAVDRETLAMLQKIRELWAHQNPNYTQAELIKKMAAFVLNKIDPQRPTTTPTTRPLQSVATSEVKKPPKKIARQYASTRYIPSPIRREVWRRDEGKCQFKSAGKTCESRFLLEIDHIRPFAIFDGSSTDPKNLRLLCRAHNQLASLQRLGSRKIELAPKETRLVQPKAPARFVDHAGRDSVYGERA